MGAALSRVPSWLEALSRPRRCVLAARATVIAALAVALALVAAPAASAAPAVAPGPVVTVSVASVPVPSLVARVLGAADLAHGGPARPRPPAGEQTPREATPPVGSCPGPTPAPRPPGEVVPVVPSPAAATR